MLDDVQLQIERISDKADTYTHYQKLFNMSAHEYPPYSSSSSLLLLQVLEGS